MTPLELWNAIATWAPKYAGLLIVLLILITANWLAGILQAVKEGTFVWKKIADILPKYFLAVFGWTIVNFLASLPALPAVETGLDVFSLAYYGAFVAALVAAILGHVSALSSGVFDLSKVGLPPTAPDKKE